MKHDELHHQVAIFKEMGQPSFYPHDARHVKCVDTHISKVFLTGTFVYKLKKAVDFGFLDFSTLVNRAHFCREEVDLNLRLAEHVYLGVLPITMEENGYSLNGPGKPVEYAVKMIELPENDSLKSLLKKNLVSSVIMDKLAYALSVFYSRAEIIMEEDPGVQWDVIQGNCNENFSQVGPFIGEILDGEMVRFIEKATDSFLTRKKKIFINRIKTGKFRDCHGDLRTGHIYITKKYGIQVIDCIEFNKRFRYQDSISDLAFLTMDMDTNGWWKEAERLLDLYASDSGDYSLYVFLNFYKCYRAFVRCKVNCFRLSEKGLTLNEISKITELARDYLHWAHRYAMKFSRPVFLVIFGMPASGKSYLTSRVSELLSIRQFSSDILRKKEFSVPVLSHDASGFRKGIYSERATGITYEKLLLSAQNELKNGRSVCVDATFSKKQFRKEAIRLAEGMGMKIVMAECFSSHEILKERLKKRKSGESVSDARIRDFESFRNAFEPVSEMETRRGNHIRINTEKSPEVCLAVLLKHIQSVK